MVDCNKNKNVITETNEQTDTHPAPLSRTEILQKFKTALEDHHLLCGEDNDDILLRFLRAKDFRISDAVQLYKRHTAWKCANKDLLKIPFSVCLPIYLSKKYTVFKKKDELSRSILHIRAEQWDPSETTLEMELQTLFQYIDEIQQTEEDQRNGIVGIFDMNAMTIGRAAQIVSSLSIKNVKTLIGYASGAFPVKVKAIHFLNAPFLVAAFYAGVKYLIKNKLRDRIHMHYSRNRGYENFHLHIGKDYLPQSLGGNIPDESVEDFEVVNSIFRKNGAIYPS